MNKKAAIVILLLAALSYFFYPTLTKQFTLPDVHTVSILDYGKELVIHTGGGRTLYRRQAFDNPNDTLTNERFTFASLSYDANKLLVVRALDRPNSPGGKYKPKNYSLDLIHCKSGKSTNLLSTDEDTPILSPIWTKDGETIYVLRGNEVVSLKPDGTENWGYPIEHIVFSQSTYKLGTGGYIRLNKFEDTLYMCATNQKRENHKITSQVAKFQLHTKYLKWLSGFRVYSKWGKVTISQGSTKQGDFDEAVHSLFGDKRYPSYNPIPSTDERYFFYYTWKEGFFAKYWIEGYDRHTNNAFTALIADRRIYAE